MAAGRKTITGTMEQWACKVIGFSSQYDTHGWSASSALGASKVYPSYGDSSEAWTQSRCDKNEFIELGYQTPVYVSAIKVYETWNCGAVKRISVRSPRGSWDTVWETDQVQLIEESRIFSPSIQSPSYRTKAVRLDVDCTACQSWVEIDAVQLVGRRLRVESPPPVSRLTDDLATLVNDSETSDVMFQVEGKTINAHRCILSARSHRLKDKLTPSTPTAVIPINDIGHDAFLGVLHYIYSGSIPAKFDPVLLVDVWRAAYRLELGGLLAYCVAVIDEKMEAENVVNIYTTACKEEPVSEDIREVCLEFMAYNMAPVSLTPPFKELPQHLMLEIVQLSTARQIQE